MRASRHVPDAADSEEPITGWTTDTVHIRLMRNIDDLRELLEAKIAAGDEAVNIRVSDFKELMAQVHECSREALQRADGIDTYNKMQANEWRKSLEDLSNRFMTSAVGGRIQVDLQRIELALTTAVKREDLTKINSDIEKLRDAASVHTGSAATFSNIITNGISILAIVIVVIMGLFSTLRTATVHVVPDSAVVTPGKLGAYQ